MLCRSHAHTITGYGRSWQTPPADGCPRGGSASVSRGEMGSLLPCCSCRASAPSTSAFIRVATHERESEARVSACAWLAWCLCTVFHVVAVGSLPPAVSWCGSPEDGAAALLRMAMQRGRPAGISLQLGLPLLGLFYPLISQVLFSSEFSPVSLRAVWHPAIGQSG